MDIAQLVSLILILWMVIYPVDSAIQRLNNRGQAPVVEKVDNTIHCMDKSVSNG